MKRTVAYLCLGSAAVNILIGAALLKATPLISGTFDLWLGSGGLPALTLFFLACPWWPYIPASILLVVGAFSFRSKPNYPLIILVLTIVLLSVDLLLFLMVIAYNFPFHCLHTLK